MWSNKGMHLICQSNIYKTMWHVIKKIKKSELVKIYIDFLEANAFQVRNLERNQLEYAHTSAGDHGTTTHYDIEKIESRVNTQSITVHRYPLFIFTTNEKHY